MEEIHPVLFIHTVPWCVLCKNLTKPENWNYLVNIVQSLNPATEIKVIRHITYDKLNVDDGIIYPREIKKIHSYPCFVILPSNLAGKDGSMENAHIFMSEFNKSTGIIEPIQENIPPKLSDWLSKHLQASSTT